jgi:hypothetical protein
VVGGGGVVTISPSDAVVRANVLVGMAERDLYHAEAEFKLASEAGGDIDAAMHAVIVARTALRRYRERYELLTGRAP